MSVTFDLYGSTLTAGWNSGRHDRAVRRCRVEGLTISAEEPHTEHTLLRRAIDEVTDTQGVNIYHSIDNLPLQQIRASQEGPTQAIVELIYARDRFIGHSGTSFADAAMTQGYEDVDVYRKTTRTTGVPPNDVETFIPFVDGMPAGDMFELKDPLNGDERPRATNFKRPITRIQAPFGITFNPIVTVFPYQRFVNDGPINFGGLTFVANTVRYDGLVLTHAVNSQNPAVGFFTGHYIFTANYHRWLKQIPKFGLHEDGTIKEWHTVNVDEYERADFLKPGFPD